MEDQQIARRVSADANKDANIDGDEDVKDAGECGPECQNLLHELDHPKEDERCSGPGQVIDIWGYCRYTNHPKNHCAYINHHHVIRSTYAPPQFCFTNMIKY